MTKILIAGIGGVGGYFGGLLAKTFHTSENVEIYFIARGNHLSEIKQNGLKVVTKQQEWIATPKLATDNPADVGKMDVIILCTKTYDLEQTLNQLGPCISDKTIILPLQNGVNSKERILKLYPNNVVSDGCVYIVSRLTEPGKIENSGTIETLYFGDGTAENQSLIQLEQLLKEAGIHAFLSKDILSIIWEKFIFISSIATSTSYYNSTVGEILVDQDKETTLLKLINEVTQVAKAKQISIHEQIVEITLNKLKSLAFETTSSMHSDFMNQKGNTELEALTGFVISESKKYGLNCPTFEEMYASLKTDLYLNRH